MFCVTQVFSATTAICTAVTMSRLDYNIIFGHVVLTIAGTASAGLNILNTSTFVCSMLLLVGCIGIVVREIVFLLCTVVFNQRLSDKIVFIIVRLSVCMHAYNIMCIRILCMIERKLLEITVNCMQDFESL